MKLPVCLIGEDSLALASLKQQFDKEGSLSVDSRIHSYGDAFDALKGRSGPLVAWSIAIGDARARFHGRRAD